MTSPRRGRPRKTTEQGQQGKSLKAGGLPKQGSGGRKLIQDSWSENGCETEVLSPLSMTRGRPLKRRADNDLSGERVARVLRTRDPNLPKSPIGPGVSCFFFKWNILYQKYTKFSIFNTGISIELRHQ